ncbi:MAG: Gfo/Idh/MocA family oxidoreductase [Isosphaeraceae bacterium]
MQPTPNGTRREFLKQSTTTLAAASVLSAPTIITSRALGNSQQGPASDRLTLGFIGMGTMNRGHLRNFLGRKDTQVVAVCDVDRVRRESSKGIVEEHYAPEKGGRFDGCTSYNDFHEMLAREDLDAVVIATPDHWHAIAVIEACKAKKDIYCEKPLTLTIHEAKVLIDCVGNTSAFSRRGASSGPSSTADSARPASTCGADGSAVLAVYVGVGGPSKPCDLPGELAEEGLDWDRWLGPARVGRITRRSVRAAFTSTSRRGETTRSIPAAA